MRLATPGVLLLMCPVAFIHGSTFALDGSVTRGPAARPLAEFVARLDATSNRVTIALSS